MEQRDSKYNWQLLIYINFTQVEVQVLDWNRVESLNKYWIICGKCMSLLIELPSCCIQTNNNLNLFTAGSRSQSIPLILKTQDKHTLCSGFVLFFFIFLHHCNNHSTVPQTLTVTWNYHVPLPLLTHAGGVSLPVIMSSCVELKWGGSSVGDKKSREHKKYKQSPSPKPLFSRQCPLLHTAPRGGWHMDELQEA